MYLKNFDPNLLPSNKTLTVLIVDGLQAYAYHGVNIKNGSKYNYKDLEAYLANQKSRTDFVILIKPGKKSSYQSTVDVLDIMTVEKIKNYKMEDPTKEEQAFIDKLLSRKVE